MNFSKNIKTLAGLGLLLFVSRSEADWVVTSWTPLFRGIDHAVGTNFSTFPASTFTNNGVVYPDATLQVVHCVRIDLADPGVQLFPTPRAPSYNPPATETQAYSISNFMRISGVQVAADANFYTTSQGNDPTTEGIGATVEGLLICTGQVVSAVSADNRYASLLFTTNKVPTFVFNNSPPGTNTAGIYTAITGFYPVLSNGVNFGLIASNTYFDNSIHQLQPRTAFGISQDKRYLFMMTIDGRQNNPPYSNGAYDTDTANWLQVFGAWDGVNMDGGGSTAMYSSDCVGNPVPLSHSSYVASRNKERIIGSHFGVYAQPLSSFIYNVLPVPGGLTANITWTTQTNATSQVEYGLTTSYGTFSPLDSTPVTDHSVTLSGLRAGTKYYFRVLSEAGGTQYASTCGGSSFTTTNIGVTLAFDLTKDWKFTTANLDGVNWQAANYDHAAWDHGPGVLWADSRPGSFPSPSSNQIPNYYTGQRMPINPVLPSYPYVTYYFRTEFVFPGPLAGASLIFSNYIDDGAVFYLNGVELYRANMPVGTILNSTTSGSYSCTDATCPAVFTFTDNAIGNLVVGTNLLAVEVHNYVANSPDVTFESALFYVVQPPSQIITNVVASPGETNVTITWTTTTNATTQVQYGLTPALSSSNALDATLVTSHSVLLNGLQPLTTYYFRVLSTAGGSSFSADGTFTTTAFSIPVVTAVNSWKYTTNNLDGMDWMAANYNDSAWLGQGPALLYIEDNPGVSPLGTALPSDANGSPFPAYYFRTHFTVSNSLAGLALLFTSYIDDGAVFYLNGTEIQRVRMPAGPITYTTFANGCPVNNCEATLDVPDVFRLSGAALTNVVIGGGNVLAAEVHQLLTNDTDVVFGSTVELVRALASETELTITRSSNVVCLAWHGERLTLQRALTLGGTNNWVDVSGPIRNSPYCVTNPPASTYYRLRD